MSTKYFPLVCSIMLCVILVSACGSPAATPSPEKPRDHQEAPAEPAAPNNAPEFFAPAATEAPAAAAPQPFFVAPESRQSEKDKNPPPGDMFFEDYGVNPSIDTDEDNLSTFALDVDTGSYTVARNYINEGNIPPSDAIRVEEFVNYFKQDYPIPSEHRAFGIYIDGAPTPFNETERYQMLRVGIQGYSVPEEDRKDVSLTFVIDVSGSMNRENRLELVKDSLELLVNRLTRRDSVSIVVYGTEARIVLEPTPGDEYRQIMRAIDNLQPEGVTNAEAGLRLGYQMANEAFNRDGINRVILCSDGVANFGETSAGGIWAEIEEYANKSITLTTIGFGMGNYNDTLMEQLADNGDGFYAYVDDIDEAERLFVDNLTSTLQTIALDAKVQVEFNPEVVIRYRLVGFENRDIADEDFRDNSVDAGEIGAGHSVTALYEIKLYPDASGRIATVSMRWKDPDTREMTEISQDFNTRDMARDFEEADPHFQWDVIVAEYAEILRDSRWAEESSLRDVLNEAERISEYLEHDSDVEEFVSLVRRANKLSRH